MDFCNAVKKIRKEHNLTQEALAAELHVSRQAISNWENEKNLPDIEITKIEKARLNVVLTESRDIFVTRMPETHNWVNAPCVQFENVPTES